MVPVEFLYISSFWVKLRFYSDNMPRKLQLMSMWDQVGTWGVTYFDQDLVPNHYFL